MANKGKRGLPTVVTKVSPVGITSRDKHATLSLPSSAYGPAMVALGKPVDGTTIIARNETTDYVVGKHVVTFSTLPGSKTRKCVLRMAHAVGVKVLPLAKDGEYYVECCTQWWSIQGDKPAMESFFQTCTNIKDVIGGFAPPDSNGKHDIIKPYDVRQKANTIKRTLASASAAIRLPDSRI